MSESPETKSSPVIPGKFRILCADDNVPVLAALASGLHHHGFEVVTARDGRDALGRFEEQNGNFNAILTDHDMPQMNGLEFVRCVRKTGFDGPILIISGSLEPDDTAAYSRYSISDFFAKPYDMEELVKRILQVAPTPQENRHPAILSNPRSWFPRVARYGSLLLD